MMDKGKTDTLPIGYWLKEVDRLLTEQSNQAQIENGVSRVEWQILNLLRENGRVSDEDIFSTMRTFVAAAEFQEIICNLLSQGWIDQAWASGELQLTCAGYDQYARMLVVQKEVRQHAMQGISQDEYATVMRVLQQIVENLQQPASFVANRLGG